MLAADPLAAAKAAHLRYIAAEGPGILRKRRGKGFVYVGPDSKPVTNKATLRRIQSLAIPPAWENVWICPLESGHIQVVGRDARGRKQYRYHPRYREVRDQAKFGRMLAFGAALPKIRVAVDRDLSLPGLAQRKVVAAIVRLLDETCIRVGNEEYAKSNKSFGLTTLRDRHAKIHGDSLHFHFQGKSHQEHDITLRDRRLARIVKRCQDLPGQELFQYETDTGEIGKVDSGDVNEYLREITKEDFTAKDFRTWHGTKHMAQTLLALGPCRTENEAKRNIVEAVKDTARRLGNRPSACRKYYIHPAIFESYTEQTMFTLMPKAATESVGATAEELRPLELAVLRLVQVYLARRSEKKAS
jgi:DNA topoisomerase-1